MGNGHRALDRRAFVTGLAALGVGGPLVDALWGRVREQQRITKDMLDEAEAVAGLQFTDDERELLLDGVNDNLEAYEAIRATPVPNAVPPALHFDPDLPGALAPARAGVPESSRSGRRREGGVRPSRTRSVRRPSSLESVAFWPVTRLSELIRTRQVRSVELTEMYLDRLRRHGPRLEAVMTLTDELALEQAERADAELSAGVYRGPLHGIPWGAKDLLAARGYRTTWGAKPFEDQVIPEDATVVRRLEEAGAVLVAKLTLGALAWGDVWFGGRTRNPWNLEQGSSGSSAGPGAATAAGLVGFSIGSETLGSIVSPSTRNGVTGLRPSFGRVSRWGAMALSWSMDKLGPMCRSVEDCALVLEAIHGPDDKDPTVKDVAFEWEADRPLSDLVVGYLASAFEDDEARGIENDRRALDVVRGLGVEPVPIELPDEYPVDALGIILSVEAAAAFDELTRSGRDDLLVRQIENAWPNVFRQARLIPAVEYLQANRIRTMLMGAMARKLDGIDVFITPSFGGNQLLITNLTGHPAVVVPDGFDDEGSPTSISFVGNLWKEAEALTLARAYQHATDWHERVPAGFAPA